MKVSFGNGFWGEFEFVPIMPDFPTGLMIYHPHQEYEGVECSVYISFVESELNDYHPWRILQDTDKFSVVPSIVCTDCGLHGFITEGTWGHTVCPPEGCSCHQCAKKAMTNEG